MMQNRTQRNGGNVGSNGVLYVRCASRGTKAGLAVLCRRCGLSASALAECLVRRAIAADPEAAAELHAADGDDARNGPSAR